MEGSKRIAADGDDYTWMGRTVSDYDMRTGPERVHAQVDDLEGRVRRLETQLRQEIRAIAEKLQQIECILEQYTDR